MTASNDTRTVWADISYFQKPVTNSYPEPMLAYRVDTGGSTDTHAAANHAWCEKTDRLKVEVGYAVLIPGHETAIVARYKNLYGSQPPPKLAAMIDMESGAGFAGKGDHSTAGNKLADLLADWLGDQKRVIAYANAYDYAQCWPKIATWLKPRRITANYSANWPGTWAQQYYGGVAANPSPAGLPRSMAPFGSNVDLNYAKRSIDQIMTDLGLAPTPTPEDDDMTPAQMTAWANSADGQAALEKAAEGAVKKFLVGSDGHQYGFLTIFDQAIATQIPKIAAAVAKEVSK